MHAGRDRWRSARDSLGRGVTDVNTPERVRCRRRPPTVLEEEGAREAVRPRAGRGPSVKGPLYSWRRIVAPVGAGGHHVSLDVFGEVGETVLAQAVANALFPTAEPHCLGGILSTATFAAIVIAGGCLEAVLGKRAKGWLICGDRAVVLWTHSRVGRRRQGGQGAERPRDASQLGARRGGKVRGGREAAEREGARQPER